MPLFYPKISRGLHLFKWGVACFLPAPTVVTGLGSTPHITNGLFPNWARTLPHPDPPTNPFGSGATGQKNTSLDKVYLLRDRCCPTFGSDGTVASGEARGMKV